MQLAPSKSRALEFPIGDKTYVVPPCGVSAGMKLAELLTASEAERAKLKMKTVDLFRLALGDVWEQMTTDDVPYTEAFRVGTACLSREQTLLYESGPDRWDKADEVAKAVWDSGIDPNQLAAYMAARTGTATRPKTRPAAATTTPRRASGSGATSRRSNASGKPKPRAPRSSGPSSGTRGR